MERIFKSSATSQNPAIALCRKSFVLRRYHQPADARQRSDFVIGYAVEELLLLMMAGEVIKVQDGDGRLS